jgi:hypothetical protein
VQLAGRQNKQQALPHRLRAPAFGTVKLTGDEAAELLLHIRY